MNGIPYIDELIKEYLLFRGYMKTFSGFMSEQSSDATRSGRVGPIVEALFQHIDELNLRGVLDMWQTLVTRIFSQLPAALSYRAKALRSSLLKLYLVTAMKRKQKNLVSEFFQSHAASLTSEDGVDENNEASKWQDWLALPYVKDAKSDSRFAACFDPEWAELLEISMRNILSRAFRSISLPSLLAYQLQLLESKQHKAEIQSLRAKIEALEHKLTVYAQHNPSEKKEDTQNVTRLRATAHIRKQHEKQSAKSPTHKDMKNTRHARRARQKAEGQASSPQAQHFEILSTISVKGHDGAVGCVRFSSDGRRLAAGGADGILRVWEFSDAFLQNSPSSSHAYTKQARQHMKFQHMNAVEEVFGDQGSAVDSCYSLIGTEFCRVPVGAVEWDQMSDDLLLCGTHNSKIRLWSAKQRRVLRTTVISRDPVGRISALACSPKRPVFVAAVHSGVDSSTEEGIGDGTLVAVSLQTGKHIQVFAMAGGGGPRTQHGGGASQVSSAVFNHNGNMLLTGASDGVVRIFELSSNRPIMAWPAYYDDKGIRRPLSCVKFSAGETTVLTASAGNGIIHEWSLHKLGRPLRTFRIDSFDSKDTKSRPESAESSWHQIAIDADGHHFLTSTGHYLPSQTRLISKPLHAHSRYLYQLQTGPQNPAPKSPAKNLSSVVGSDHGLTSIETDTSMKQVDTKATELKYSVYLSNSESKIATASTDSNSTIDNSEAVKSKTVSPVIRKACAQIFSFSADEGPVQSIAHGEAMNVTSVDWHPSLDIIASSGSDGTTKVTTLLMHGERTTNARSGGM